MTGQQLIANAAEALLRERQSAVRQGKCRRVVTRQNVYAFIHCGDGKRFASLFMATWKRLPLSVRRQILVHWRNCQFDDVVVRISPIIELTDMPLNWDKFDEREKIQGVWGTVSFRGHRMRFYWPVIKAMPDGIAQDLVAHELAHVYQSACGWLPEESESEDCGYRHRHPSGETMNNVEYEMDADILMDCWGFDPYAMDEWALDCDLFSKGKELL